jgi:hypothetical protein
MLEIGTSGSVGGEGGNILAYPARSPIAVISTDSRAIDSCFGLTVVTGLVSGLYGAKPDGFGC